MSRMIERFHGDAGRELRLEALTAQSIVARDPALAEELTDLVELRELEVGQILIEQNGEDDDIFFIISGSFGIHINGRRIGGRGRGDHVGEMAAVEPTQRRSATVVAEESSLVARLTAKQFSKLAKKYPDMYRQIARSLSRRLLERNKHVGVYREKIRVFIISSAESLPVARLVRNAFEHDPFLTTIWTDGVFRVANYTLQDLEAEVDDSDFAVAIAHADDLTESRGKDWPSPRDNVVFELGLFMGKLGRQRAILMEPREEKVNRRVVLADTISLLDGVQIEIGKAVSHPELDLHHSGDVARPVEIGAFRSSRAIERGAEDLLLSGPARQRHCDVVEIALPIPEDVFVQVEVREPERLRGMRFPRYGYGLQFADPKSNSDDGVPGLVYRDHSTFAAGDPFRRGKDGHNVFGGDRPPGAAGNSPGFSAGLLEMCSSEPCGRRGDRFHVAL